MIIRNYSGRSLDISLSYENNVITIYKGNSTARDRPKNLKDLEELNTEVQTH